MHGLLAQAWINMLEDPKALGEEDGDDDDGVGDGRGKELAVSPDSWRVAKKARHTTAATFF